MKVKLIGIRGYDYVDKKTGERKQGAVLRVCSAVPYEVNDYNGNFEYGCRCDNIYLPRSYYDQISDLIANMGKVYHLVKEKQLGDSYESLTELELLE